MENMSREEIMKDVNHRIGIAWEQFEGQFKFIAELLQSGLERLERKIDDVRIELKNDIEFTQQAIRTVNRDLSAQIRENRIALARIETRLDDIDQRTSRNERQILKLQDAINLT